MRGVPGLRSISRCADGATPSCRATCRPTRKPRCTWVLKDEIIARGRIYYAKLARGKAMFLAPRMIPYFHAIWGMRRSDEAARLSRSAQAIVRVLRKEWEMSSVDLRTESGVKKRAAFTRALDELQAAMIVVPSAGALSAEVHLHLDAGGRPVPRGAETARRSRHRATRDRPRLSRRRRNDDCPAKWPGSPGVSRRDAGRGNRALVAEGYATTSAPGVYRLAAEAAWRTAGSGANEPRDAA